MIQQKLIDFRKKVGFTQEQMAKHIAMEQTTYSRKELGKSAITNEEWLRLAKALNTSIEELREENSINLKNDNCTFNEHAIGITYVNIPQSILDIALKYNAKLEEENKLLKAELEKKNGG